MRHLAGVFLFVLACSLALTEAPANASPTTWKRSTPEAQGLDSRVLVDGLKRIRDEGVDLHSMIVYRHGHVVLECYVHPYDATTLHNVK
ncbi:hypothetical protein DRQ32_10570, partial [bacterium]